MEQLPGEGWDAGTVTWWKKPALPESHSLSSGPAGAPFCSVNFYSFWKIPWQLVLLSTADDFPLSTNSQLTFRFVVI